MRRGGEDMEEIPGGDSFLDVVANIVGILVLAALVTPPDVVTQLILFTVVYGLYEVSIFLVRRVEDIMPTLLTVAGLAVPQSCDGIDMVGEQRRDGAPPRPTPGACASWWLTATGSQHASDQTHCWIRQQHNSRTGRRSMKKTLTAVIAGVELSRPCRRAAPGSPSPSAAGGVP